MRALDFKRYRSKIPSSSMQNNDFQQNLLHTLSPTDKISFSKFGIGSIVEYPFHCIHHYFESQARIHASSIAVEDFQGKVTYAELDHKANCLASLLRKMEIVPGTRVCLLVERSIFMVIGILGILKAGAAYIPLDGNTISDESLAHTIRDSRSRLALVQRRFAERVSGIPTISLEDSICYFPSTSNCQKPEDLSSPNDSAYIIYKSGTSTSASRGVDVMHKNIINLVYTAPGNLSMCAGLRVSQLMNISCDMAAWEILGSLCNGSTLCIGRETYEDRSAIMKIVDVVIATPSILAPHKPSDFPNIRIIAVSGESFPKALADEWSKTTQFYNCYGSTEVTTVNTMELHSFGRSLTIGRPIPNNTLYILNDQMKPVKIGEVGIMWAGGAGVTRGYLNLPGKTTEKYRPDPFMRDGSFMFNSGDLGRWYPDGNLQYLGRIERRVKINDHWVELDGVASAMETCPGVKVAAVVPIEDELWGFFMPSSVEIEDVKTATSSIQPHYAIPTRFIKLDHFPETSEGKVDKWALQQLAVDSVTTPRRHLYFSQPPPARHLSLPASSKPESTHREDENSPVRSVVTTSHYYRSSSMVNIRAMETGTAKGFEAHLFAEQGVSSKNVQGGFMGSLRRQIVYMSLRLFGVVFLANLSVLIWVSIMGMKTVYLEKIIIGNLFVAVLMRQDYVINIFFIIFTAVPSSWPLFIRRICARVYQIGDLHSSTGVSGVIWLILFAAQVTKEMVEGQNISTRTVGITYAILALLLLILAFTHPTLRIRFHANFEAAHRFLGWIITTLVWVQVIFFNNDKKVPGQSLGVSLLHSASFWMIVVMTASLASPWTRLKKVELRCEPLSPYAIRMHFNYTNPLSGSFIRLSEKPWGEWHSFAAVPDPGKVGFSVVVSRAKGWSIKQIENSPNQFWTRGIPTLGIMRIAPMFRRIVLVATGSGIGPCKSALLDKKTPIRLLWTAPDVREAFGDEFVDTILTISPNSMIYNTRESGTPDMVELTHRLVEEFDAEAVIIISNKKQTEEIIYGMTCKGIPAFGVLSSS